MIGSKNGLPIYSTSCSEIDLDLPIVPTDDADGDDDQDADEHKGSEQPQIDQPTADDPGQAGARQHALEPRAGSWDKTVEALNSKHDALLRDTAPG